MPCEIILVVHALTQWNLDGRCQGHVDTPLCERGRKDALALARRLMRERIDAIYSSDLRRAVETGLPLSKIKRIPIRTDPRLREGRWALQERTAEFPILPYSKEVESRKEVRARMIEVMTDIGRMHRDERVVVVSHMGPVKQFIQYVSDVSSHPVPEFVGTRAAVNRLIYDDGEWFCVVLDDVSHLEQPSPPLT